MNSRERVLTTLNHQEPDRVPFDFGGTGMTGMHKSTYAKLRAYLGLPPVEIRTEDIIQQLAVIDEDVANRLGTTCRNVAPRSSALYKMEVRDEGNYSAYTDEWGIGWRMPKSGGYYYDMASHPMRDVQSVEDITAFLWPDPTDPQRFNGLRQRARQAHDSGYIVILGGLCAGVTEMHAWLRGYENYYTDFHSQAVLSENIMDKVVDLKMAYWEVALSQAGEYVDVVMEADDMAGQERLLISPRTYRQFIKPRHARLFNFIKTKAPVKLFFHSCGAVRPLLGDLIETGIDIINPVQKSAAGMDLNELKNEFGKDLVFWGGGVDTQRVFSKGSSEQVREDVKRSIDALAPGGGFIFGTVHNTQADVSPENFMTMWETLQDYGGYR